MKVKEASVCWDTKLAMSDTGIDSTVDDACSMTGAVESTQQMNSVKLSKPIHNVVCFEQVVR